MTARTQVFISEKLLNKEGISIIFQENSAKRSKFTIFRLYSMTDKIKPDVRKDDEEILESS